MLRSFRITVNGKTYDVTVEEAGGGPVSVGTPVFSSTVPVQAASAVPASSAGSPSASASPSAAPILSPANTPAHPSSAVSPGTLGAGVIKAPIPGTVNSIKVTENQTVAKGDVVLLLEAMKMENEICAQADGIITRIFVQTGTMVNTGDPLLDIS